MARRRRGRPTRAERNEAVEAAARADDVVMRVRQLADGCAAVLVCAAGQCREVMRICPGDGESIPSHNGPPLEE